MPLRTNSRTKPTTNSGRDSRRLAVQTTAAPTAIAAKFQQGMGAPPNRSRSGPPPGPVGQRAPDGPDQRAEQRPEPGKGGGRQRRGEGPGELVLQHLAEGE